MQRPGVAARLWPELAAGTKRRVIRWREPAIVPGPMRHTHASDPGRDLIVPVHRVTEMPLRRAAAFVGRAEEWSDDAMLAGMRGHCRDIELDDIVRVIGHGPPVG